MVMKSSFKYAKHDFENDLRGYGHFEAGKYWTNYMNHMIYAFQEFPKDRLVNARTQVDLSLQLNYCHELVLVHRKWFDDNNIDRNDISKLRKDNKEIDYNASQITFGKRLLEAIQDLLKGLSWRFYDYDRSFLSTVNIIPPAGYPDRSPGMIREYEYVLGLSHDHNCQALLFNSIIHSFNLGDVSVLNKDGLIEIWEIKSSKGGRGRQMADRIERQKIRMLDHERLYNERESIIDGEHMYIVDSDIEINSDLKKNMKLIESEVYNKGYCVSNVSEHVVLFAVDLMHDSDDDLVSKSYDEAFEVAKGLWPRNDRVILSDIVKILSSNNPNTPPISIWPASPRFIADILAKRVIISCYINVNKIIERVKRVANDIVDVAMLNISQEDDIREVMSGPSARIVYKSNIIDIPWVEWSRLAYEFVDIESYVESLLQLLTHSNQLSEKKLMISFSKEGLIWS